MCKGQKPSFFPYSVNYFFNCFLIARKYIFFKIHFQAGQTTIEKVARNLRLLCAFKCICWMHFAYPLIAHVRFLVNSPLFWHKPFWYWGCQVARCLELILIFHIQNETISYKYTLTLLQQPHQAFAITKTNHIWQFVSTCAKVFTLERFLFLNSVFLAEIKLSMA